VVEVTQGLQNVGSESNNQKPRKLNHPGTVYSQTACHQQIGHCPIDCATLFVANPEAALLLLSMIGQAQLSIDDLLGQLSRQFTEQLLVPSAQTVADPKHPGRRAG
jgi:hypothetical protein